MSFAGRLYRGEVSFDFLGRRKIWYAASGAVLLASILSLLLIGIRPSIDFKGGAVFTVDKKGATSSQAEDAVRAAGVTPEVVQSTGVGLRIETPDLSNAQIEKVEKSLSSRLNVPTSAIASESVGATWGGQITNKAVEALVAFLIAVVAYLSVRFEPKMALAAIIALLHDLVITGGIYAMSRLEVSPDTIVALLTILGYSLYDTVVVFDKVRENTVGLAGGSRMTYRDAANLAVNQTLVRSINTSVIGLFPVFGLLVIGAGLLGAGSLENLSFALLIGLLTGSYSSIFIATPLLSDFKEREPQYQQLRRRVAARQVRQPVAAGVGAGVTGAGPTSARGASAGEGRRLEGSSGAQLDDGAGPDDHDPGAAGEPDDGLAADGRPTVAHGAGASPARQRGTTRPATRRKGNRGRPSGKKRR